MATIASLTVITGIANGFGDRAGWQMHWDAV